MYVVAVWEKKKLACVQMMLDSRGPTYIVIREGIWT